MAQLNPYITFKGNCRQAMMFYKEALGCELTMQTVGESPAASHMPTETHNNILHSALTKDGQTILLASDMMMGGNETIQGNTMSLCLNCDSEEQINTFHSNLSVDAQNIQALREEFWGAIYGEVVDKYGFRWIFNFDKPVS